MLRQKVLHRSLTIICASHFNREHSVTFTRSRRLSEHSTGGKIKRMMWWERSEEQEPLTSSSDTHSDEDSDEGPFRRKPFLSSRPKLAIEVVFLLSTVFISFSAGFFLRPSWNSTCIDTAWATVKKNVQYQPQEFNPRFTGPLSKFMGPPQPELDQRWYALSKMYTYAVNHATLVKLNRTRGAVQLPGKDAYVVSAEAFHQLHCLNYVRMYTNQSYYEGIDFDMMAESPEERRDHKDHCVEVVRQRLMCAPDLNIYTHHWVGHSNLPLANLYTPHQKCIDWDAFSEWQLSQSIPGRSVVKPVDAEVLY